MSAEQLVGVQAASPANSTVTAVCSSGKDADSSRASAAAVTTISSLRPAEDSRRDLKRPDAGWDCTHDEVATAV